MKSYLPIVSACLIFCSCASTPSPSENILEASKNYQKIGKLTSRDEVYKILGLPQNRLEDGREQWLVTDDNYRAEFLLKFDSAGNILSMEKHYPML